MRRFKLDLENVVWLTDDNDEFTVGCSWCSWEAPSPNMDEANTAKIEHENEHGIFSDPMTGALWHDPEEDMHRSK